MYVGINTQSPGYFYDSETTKIEHRFFTVQWVRSPNATLFKGWLYSIWYCSGGYMAFVKTHKLWNLFNNNIPC